MQSPSRVGFPNALRFIRKPGRPVIGFELMGVRECLFTFSVKRKRGGTADVCLSVLEAKLLRGFLFWID